MRVDLPLSKLANEKAISHGDGFSPIVAEPVSWVTGEVHKYGNGFVLKPMRRMNWLPVEFWNHQLIECNIKDEDELQCFIEMWGIPFHPLRNGSPISKIRKDTGITETEKFAPSFFPKPKPGDDIDQGLFTPEWSSPALSYISTVELKSAISYLQTCVEKFVYGIGGWKMGREGLEVLNAAACNPYVLRYEEHKNGVIVDAESTRLQGRGLLTSAICNQLIEAFRDSAEWKICACEGCETIFKRKQPEKEGISPDSDSKYCCNKCKNRQVKRNQRAAAKTRIKH